MASTRFSDAVTALLAAYTAAIPLAGVTAYDGLSPTAAQDPDFIIVGHDGTLDSSGALAEVTEGGTTQQTWLSMGTPPLREETGVIRCVAVSQSGDSTDLTGRRARAEDLLEACEDAATTAGDVGGILFDPTDAASWRYRQQGQGCAVMVAYTVGYSTQW